MKLTTKNLDNQDAGGRPQGRDVGHIGGSRGVLLLPGPR